MSKLNLPNKLTLLRVILIPFFMFFIIFPLIPDMWSRIISAAIFIVTAFTDMLDGMLARKMNLITDFGKFLDPVADKLMTIGGMLALLVKNREDSLFVYVFVCAVFIVIVREISITSLRMLVVNTGDIVIPANWLGKIKTVTQMLCVIAILLEPVILGNMIISYILIVIMTVMTVLSGFNYFKAYWSFIDPNK